LSSGKRLSQRREDAKGKRPGPVKKRTLVVGIGAVAVAAAVGALSRPWNWPVLRRVVAQAVEPRTVADAVERYGPAAEARLRPHFERVGIPFPPTRLAFLAFKQEKRLDLWAENSGRWTFVRSFPVLAASGHAGPKLREGDRQVPEGLYRIEALNPNSSYHLSLKLDYPNEFDRQHAAAEGRTRPGGDIFLHGKAVSIGCLAMGDEAIEDLFVLVARVGAANVQVVIAPNDLRRGKPVTDMAAAPAWLPGLYERIAAALRGFPLPAAAP